MPTNNGDRCYAHIPSAVVGGPLHLFQGQPEAESFIKAQIVRPPIEKSRPDLLCMRYRIARESRHRLRGMRLTRVARFLGRYLVMQTDFQLITPRKKR